MKHPVFDAIDKTVQFKKKDPNFEIQLEKKIKISLTIAENPKGTERKFITDKKTNNSLKYIKIDKNDIMSNYCTNLKKVFKVKNNDNLCLLRAYLIGKIHLFTN